jgi:hypothetical protein
MAHSPGPFAFNFGDDELTLTQMASRTGLYKSTAMRARLGISLLPASPAARFQSNCSTWSLGTVPSRSSGLAYFGSRPLNSLNVSRETRSLPPLPVFCPG